VLITGDDVQRLTDILAGRATSAKQLDAIDDNGQA
jgi:hypothetical protein